MGLAVAIVTYNRPEMIESVLEDLVSQQPEQLIIVDDSENQETKQVIEEKRTQFSSELIYIHNKEKTSFGHSRNQALDKAETEIISFIDDDVVLPDGWTENVLQAFKDIDAAAIGGPAIDSNEKGQPVVDIIKEKDNQNFCNKYGEVKDSSGKWVPPQPVETECFRGANMSFRTRELRDIGGFDTGYEGTGFREELDVLTRLRKKGEKLVYHPELKIYHIRTEQGGTRSTNVDTEYWKGRNLIYFVRKNFPENFKMALIRLLIHTDGYPEPLWKDLLGAIIYRKPRRLFKFKGYIDEVVMR